MNHHPLDNLRAAAASLGRDMNRALPAAVPQVLVPRQPVLTQPVSQLDHLMNLAQDDNPDFSSYAEINRIINLPVRLDLPPEQHEEINRTHLLADCYASGWRLFQTQSSAIFEYEQIGGLFGPIGVGWGKTLISFMIAGAAFRKGIRKMIYFMPPSVYNQVAEHDLRWARTKIPIPYGVHRVGGKDLKSRRNLAKSDKTGLYLVPYSLMSTRDSDDLLYSINPGLMIFDECHELRNRSAARTKRVFKFVEQNNPETIDLSGTITNKSVNDYHHLIKSSLRDNSPLPLSRMLSTEWAAVLDSDACEDGGSATGPLEPMIQWAHATFPNQPVPVDRTGFRTAYRLRLASCPGVVSSGDADIGISLNMRNKQVVNYKGYENWEVLDKIIKQVTEQWLTPNGDEIEHAIHTWKWLYELTAGFYNQLTWPTPEEYSIRKNIPGTEAESILQRAVEHHEALQDYHKILRAWLQDHHTPGLDTPFLVGQEMARNGDQNIPYEVFEAWDIAKRMDFEGRPDRDSTAIRVCPFKVHDACIWAMNEVPKGEGGVIWYYHQAIGEWVYEYLKHYGANTMHCPAGQSHNEKILDPQNANKIVVASISAHGQGKNLQHFHNQYALQWPRSANRAEQMLGRMHRNGQTVDEITMRTNHTLAWDDMNFGACLNDALYIHQTTGNRQKLIYAGYDPQPVIYSNAFLIERGLEVKKLSAHQQAAFDDKFSA